MKLYNTLTRRVEEIVPIQAPVVTVYTCGPTVYDYPHIGNWFTFVRYDLLVRVLQNQGYQPKWVMNITDVGHLTSDADSGEDKLEKGARREGKSAWDIAKFYADYFVQGLQRLNITPPTMLPKATEHIAEQIELIKQLEDKGFTYRITDGIYYDTSKFADYGKLALLDLDEQQAGARVEYNPEKRNSSDFALWKFAPEGVRRDMEWDSPWGKGFPGWHLECSAMSMKYLGETLDIHSGGIDHIPVHHTNEIAQSEAVTGKPFAHYWMHTNHITVEGEKISKSLGNGITLEDIETKGYSLEAFRLHVLESHYRSQSKFSWDSLTAAQNRLKGWEAFADLQFQGVPSNGKSDDSDYLQEQRRQIEAALSDDLATPTALRLIDETIDTIVSQAKPVNTEELHAFLAFIDQVLGLNLSKRQDITEDQKQTIKSRSDARLNQDWLKSDELRNHLIDQGIGLRDTADGAIWFRL